MVEITADPWSLTRQKHCMKEFLQGNKDSMACYIFVLKGLEQLDAANSLERIKGDKVLGKTKVNLKTAKHN